ncbi:hypothetical protein BH23PLA1_BH23PLA1_15520 [soil metagenome]
MMHPVAILAVGIGIVLVGILVLRLHAFLALLLAALTVAWLTPVEALRNYAAGQVEAGRWTDRKAEEFSTSVAAERVAEGFGETAASIGILIAMAAIIGKCLLDSGAADRIVRSTLKLVGQKRAPLAFLGSGFILAVPVFFDTVFYLLMPLGKAMWLRTKKHYLLYVLAIVAGATMAHSLVPPTPGPLFVANRLGVNLLTMIVAGSLVGLVASLAGYGFARWADRRWEIPLRESVEAPLEELEASAKRSDADLPPLWLALLQILLPIALIALATALQTYLDGFERFDLRLMSSMNDVGNLPTEGKNLIVVADVQGLLHFRIFNVDRQMVVGTDETHLSDKASQIVELKALLGGLWGQPQFSRSDKDGVITAVTSIVDHTCFEADRTPPAWVLQIAPAVANVGDKNVALVLAAAIALAMVVRQTKAGKREIAAAVQAALAGGGVIILITSAGGAFGSSINQTGISDQIAAVTEGMSPQLILPVAWLVTAMIRTAQGSATVAMITAVGVLEPLSMPGVLGVHPVYLALAIGCGSKPLAWMADSGFWVILKMSGLTEAEGLKTVTPMTGVMGVAGLLVIMIASALWPMI